MTTLHDNQRAIGTCRRDAVPDLGELCIAIAREEGDGHRQLAEAPPHRPHLARSEAPHHRRERAGVVAPLISPRQLPNFRRIVRKQRLRVPALDEVFERKGFQLIRQVPVGLAACRALVPILDPRAARDEHEPAHACGRSQSDV